MSLALTKTLDLADYEKLAYELEFVDKLSDSPEMKAQHPHRRWEYAMALKAWGEWKTRKSAYDFTYALDVGGAGSPFSKIAMRAMATCKIVDPKINSSIEDYTGEKATVIFSLSTIEHVESVDAFIGGIHRALLPGGLLFLTMDYWEGPSTDTAHFHWMRNRIFNWHSRQTLIELFQDFGYSMFGDVEAGYNGNTVYDYSFASLAMVKNA